MDVLSTLSDCGQARVAVQADKNDSTRTNSCTRELDTIKLRISEGSVDLKMFAQKTRQQQFSNSFENHDSFSSLYGTSVSHAPLPSLRGSAAFITKGPSTDSYNMASQIRCTVKHAGEPNMTRRRHATIIEQIQSARGIMSNSVRVREANARLATDVLSRLPYREDGVTTPREVSPETSCPCPPSTPRDGSCRRGTPRRSAAPARAPVPSPAASW